MSSSEKHFEIIPADKNGLYLHRIVLVNRKEHLHLIRLDTVFRFLWQGHIPIDRNYLIMGKRSFRERLFILLRYKDYSKNDFILLVINQDSGNFTRYPIKSFIPFSPAEFVLTERAVLIGGYFNRVPLVLHYSLINNKSKVLPGLFNEQGELTQIKTYDDGTFDVLISAFNFQRQRTIFIKNYEADGDLIRNYSLETDGNRHLIFGRSLKTGNQGQIVAGVFGNRQTEFSRGIFIASIDPQGVQQIRYYYYADLENFFKYMRAKREQRVKSRIERRKIKGKKIRMNYRFLVHELVPYNEQYILLGEAFYPRYINLDRGYYMGFFTPATNMRGQTVQQGRIFDGYHYTHAVVMGFRPNGDLLWDNSFEINDVKTFTLEQFVKLEVQNDRIALVYLFDNKLRTKIIKNDDVLEGKSVDPIKTGSFNDIVRKDDENTNKLEYWYNKYLFAYGIQDIINAYGQEKRRVFYINKLRPVR